MASCSLLLSLFPPVATCGFLFFLSSFLLIVPCKMWKGRSERASDRAIERASEKGRKQGNKLALVAPLMLSCCSAALTALLLKDKELLATRYLMPEMRAQGSRLRACVRACVLRRASRGVRREYTIRVNMRRAARGSRREKWAY